MTAGKFPVDSAGWQGHAVNTFWVPLGVGSLTRKLSGFNVTIMMRRRYFSRRYLSCPSVLEETLESTFGRGICILRWIFSHLECGVQHVFSERLLWQLRYLRFEFSGRSSSCNAGLRDDVNLLGVINTGGPAVSRKGTVI